MTSPSRADRTPVYDQYRRTLLTVEEVRALSVPAPWHPVRDATLAWGAILLAWGAVGWRTEWWTVLAAIPVVGAAYYALFIIAHDGLHRRLFPGRAANDLFNDLVILGAVGAITRLNNRNHLHHHDSLALPGDPDRYKYVCVDKYDGPHLVAYLSGLATVWRAARNIWAPVRGASGEQSDGYTGRDLAILLAWQVALIGGLSWGIGWWAWPVLWLVPVYAFTFLMDNLRTFAEHSHPEADAPADTHRLIHYNGLWVERIFIAPRNMNHHAAHHLWPSIPYYNLPAATARIRNEPAAAGIIWRGSYLGYLWRYWRALPLEECRPAASA